ncbi:MAG: sulfatase-like hydrolase/transferase, partial [Bdellovibrionales bacterium]|nr:sulfatase-like hydrolase/transferase [Bdellovibrionales bacterium]
LVGMLIDALKSQGIFDEALIIVTSDHGISFLPGEKGRVATISNAGDLLHVPLFVKAPHQVEARTVSDVLRSVDFVPELLSYLNLEYPWAIDGRSRQGGPQVETIAVISRDAPLEVKVQDLISRTEKTIAFKEQHFATVGRSAVRTSGVLAHPGQRIDALTCKQSNSVVASLGGLVRFESVALAADRIPTRLSGRVSFKGELQGVAFVVNGIVAATSELGDAGQFDVMLPEELLVEGGNRIQILAQHPNGTCEQVSIADSV